MKRALEGLRRYQEAERAPPPPLLAAVAQVAGAALRDYGGTGPPVLFVPSLINPPSILDLSEERSLLRWLAGRGGRRVLLLDWGWPDEKRKALGVAGHVERILLPLLHELDETADLIGYCLGGTMAAAAAQLVPIRSLTAIAAPWHFSGFPADARAKLARLWDDSRPAVDALGVLPMEALQSAFWSLDPARTVAKFESFADMTGEQAASFVTLEDWANDGPPVGGAAARELFEDFFVADLPGTRQWRVGGGLSDPNALQMPILNIVSTSDRIVPSASAMGVGERLELAQGHVGMVVGSRAKEALWEPLADWLSRTAAKC
ncbi:MAG TPA: alpha/beta fold hydrolase [Allosphingosinicella sp.]|nr:alpha/beta fold hydrolase [Allosphingosinicella sp.]